MLLMLVLFWSFFTCTPNASFSACFLMTLMLVLVRLVRNFSITPGVCFS